MATESKRASLKGDLTQSSAALPAFLFPRLLRIQDAAKYLSATIWQVETLLREKTIPSFVLGKRRVVDRLELDRYVERRNAEAKAGAEKASLTSEECNRSIPKGSVNVAA
jgi:excisionase family DNA binding protein